MGSLPHTTKSERPNRMTIPEIFNRLQSLGSEKVRTQNRRNGVGDQQFGVKLGDLRALSKEMKIDHARAQALWATGNLEARLLAILTCERALYTENDLDRMVREISSAQEADWLTSSVLSKHPRSEELRLRWITDPHPWAARAGWALTHSRIVARPEDLDLPALLRRIEAKMGTASPEVQWTMNFCLAAIGIHSPSLRAQAIAIGESLGLYRDYPVSKGCTSPFAPIWIREMVTRRGEGA